MLLDAEPPKPPSKIRRYVPLPLQILIILVVLGLAGFLIFRFWNWRQERAVSRFLTTLERGNYQQAYQLWQPAPSYTYDNFLHDWGEQGDYGKIRKFDILDSESKGPSVVVTVRINGVDPPLDLVVNSKTEGLSYSPF
jgi:hypothetical protein